jgi:signal transduction histidine kinase
VLGALVLAALVAMSLWLVGRALRPVAKMTAQAADWGEHDLGRRFYAGEPRDELTSLASVFDGLLSRLAQSLSREQRLTAEVSHELRTPLAKIRAEAELAAARDRSSEQYRSSLHAIRRHAEELQQVLETLLASARVATSASSGTHSSDACKAAERALAPLLDAARAQGKQARLECPRPLRVAVEGDVVERALSPLIENAVRHARTHIELSIGLVEGNVVFEVRDDGAGVDSAERERIFDPGVGGGRSAESSHRGAGLGLPLARRLARAAGGEVEVRSDSGGATFALLLPAALE